LGGVRALGFDVNSTTLAGAFHAVDTEQTGTLNYPAFEACTFLVFKEKVPSFILQELELQPMQQLKKVYYVTYEKHTVIVVLVLHCHRDNSNYCIVIVMMAPSLARVSV